MHVAVCRYCEATTSSYEEYQQHMKVDHHAVNVPPIYPCAKCSFISPVFDHYQLHASKHQAPTGPQIKCGNCGFQANACEEDMRAHLADCPGKVAGKAHICVSTPSAYATVRQKTKELELQKNESDSTKSRSMFHCNHLGKWRTSFSSLTSYQNHMKSRHRGTAPYELFPCLECHYITSNKPLASNHQQLHQFRKAIQCGHCFYLAPNLKELKAHIRTNICPAAMSVAETAEKMNYDSDDVEEMLRPCPKV